MIIKASQRSGARNLASHLSATHDNDHVTLQEIRGLAGQSLHAALLEIDAVSQGTRCQQPLFSVSFNPPQDQDVTFPQFDAAFAQLEKKLGLEEQPRVVVFHEKEGRHHAHVVWSRIDVMEMKAIRMSHFKRKCSDVSRDLYLEHGWDMPQGFEKKQNRDPFDLSNGEWQRLKRQGIDPRDIKAMCQEAWDRSDNLPSFQHALEEKGMYLAKGDRRGFVVMDHQHKVYSLSRHGGLKTKDLKLRLGKPDDLPSIVMMSAKIRSTYNAEALGNIRKLKAKQVIDMQPLMDQKAHLVHRQRAERREIVDQQRVKRHIVAKAGKNRFRRGITGVFDKVMGKNRRLRLVNQKEAKALKKQQVESRQKIVFRHNRERAVLQKHIVQERLKQRRERSHLAKRIVWLKAEKVRDQERNQEIKRPKTLTREFEKSSREQEGDGQEKQRKISRGRSRPRKLER